jgi:outer membrane protein
MPRTLAALMLFVAAASAQTMPPPASQKPPTSQKPATPVQQQTPPLPTSQTAKPAVPPAPPGPFPADARIGVVNMQALLSDSKLGQAGESQIKALTDKRDADLSAKNKALQALQQQIQQQSNVLSPASLSDKQSQLDRLQREGQFAQQDWSIQVQNLQQQLLNDFENKVEPIIESVRAEKKLWIVFSVADSGTAAYNRDLDLTADVVKRIDEKFPGK